jgi:hypothetical protein
MKAGILRTALTTVGTLLVLGSAGCKSLIVRPDDSAGKTTAKVTTRVLLVLPTLTLSEHVIGRAKMQEYYAQSSERMETYKRQAAAAASPEEAEHWRSLWHLAVRERAEAKASWAAHCQRGRGLTFFPALSEACRELPPTS